MKNLLLPLLIITSSLSADTNFSGYTEPIQSLDVGFPEAGRIAKILVKEGDTVKKGQIMAKLDNRVLLADLAMAKERYTMRLDRYKKIKVLNEKNSATNDELIRARTDLMIEKLTYDRIKAQIARRTLVSSINGVITEIFKEAAEGVSGVETPVLSMVEINQLVINLFIDYLQAKQLKIGDSVPVTFEDDGTTSRAQVVFISPDADKASRTVRVKLLIDNSTGEYTSGVLGTVSLPDTKIDATMDLAGPRGMMAGGS